MPAWGYLFIFMILNVLIWIGMQRIVRHLSHMSAQLDGLASLLARLHQQVEAARADFEFTQASGSPRGSRASREEVDK